LSGLGWDPNDARKGFALVSPQHFVAAEHFKPSASDSASFLNRNGDVNTYGIQEVTTMDNDDGSNSDLVLVTLDNAIPSKDEVGFFPVADLGPDAAYTGRSMFAYGRKPDNGVSPKFGTGTIASIQDFQGEALTGGSLNDTRAMQFSYNKSTGGDNDAFLEVGDSGSPSFLVEDGKLSIAGTHTAVIDNPTTKENFDTFVPNYIDEMNAAMSDEGFQVTTVPEPAFYGVGFGVIALLFAALRRRR